MIECTLDNQLRHVCTSSAAKFVIKNAHVGWWFGRIGIFFFFWVKNIRSSKTSVLDSTTQFDHTIWCDVQLSFLFWNSLHEYMWFWSYATVVGWWYNIICMVFNPTLRGTILVNKMFVARCYPRSLRELLQAYQYNIRSKYKDCVCKYVSFKGFEEEIVVFND